MHCSGGSCNQGRAPCKTPEACGAEVVGGTYWPLLAEAKPHEPPYCGDEPLSDTATACVIAFIVTVFLACTAAVIWNLLPLMQWAAN
jgi:hypothetical protein